MGGGKGGASGGCEGKKRGKYQLESVLGLKMGHETNSCHPRIPLWYFFPPPPPFHCRWGNVMVGCHCCLTYYFACCHAVNYITGSSCRGRRWRRGSSFTSFIVNGKPARLRKSSSTLICKIVPSVFWERRVVSKVCSDKTFWSIARGDPYDDGIFNPGHCPLSPQFLQTAKVCNCLLTAFNPLSNFLCFVCLLAFVPSGIAWSY